MSIAVRVLEGEALEDVLSEVARLRIEVFRDFPYLYDGDFEYERGYLDTYRDNPNAVLVGAFDGTRLIGASTGSTLASHDEAFRAPVEAAGFDVKRVFYCAESVLTAGYRGRGLGHAFFDAREAWACRHGMDASLFCAVLREENHPLRPSSYRPLDGFWRKRGYQRLEGVETEFSWKSIETGVNQTHRLAFWHRKLGC